MMRRMKGLVVVALAGLALTLSAATTARAGKIRRGTWVTPGSQSDPVSDYGLGIEGTFTTKGIRISNVEAGSPAERVGLESGDMVLAVNGNPVNDPVAWSNAMSGGGFVRLRIRNVRGGPIVFRNVNLADQGGQEGVGSGTSNDDGGGE